MNALTIINTLTIAKTTSNKLETATNVLNELNKMKSIKGMPFFAIRRAIKIQEGIVNKLSNK